MNIEIIISLRLKDLADKSTWETPNHNDKKKKDDYHGEHGVKQDILYDLDEKIKQQFGKNPDVEIMDGKIVVVSQRVNIETGVKSKKQKVTELDAEDYFNKITTDFLTLFFPIIDELEKKYKHNLIVTMKRDNINNNEMNFSIHFS